MLTSEIRSQTDTLWHTVRAMGIANLFEVVGNL